MRSGADEIEVVVVARKVNERFWKPVDQSTTPGVAEVQVIATEGKVVEMGVSNAMLPPFLVSEEVWVRLRLRQALVVPASATGAHHHLRFPSHSVDACSQQEVGS